MELKPTTGWEGVTENVWLTHSLTDSLTELEMAVNTCVAFATKNSCTSQGSQANPGADSLDQPRLQHLSLTKHPTLDWQHWPWRHILRGMADRVKVCTVLYRLQSFYWGEGNSKDLMETILCYAYIQLAFIHTGDNKLQIIQLSNPQSLWIIYDANFEIF